MGEISFEGDEGFIFCKGSEGPLVITKGVFLHGHPLMFFLNVNKSTSQKKGEE